VPPPRSLAGSQCGEAAVIISARLVTDVRLRIVVGDTVTRLITARERQLTASRAEDYEQIVCSRGEVTRGNSTKRFGRPTSRTCPSARRPWTFAEGTGCHRAVWDKDPRSVRENVTESSLRGTLHLVYCVTRSVLEIHARAGFGRTKLSARFALGPALSKDAIIFAPTQGFFLRIASRESFSSLVAEDSDFNPG